MNEKNTEQRTVSRVLQARAKHRKWVATLLALAVIVCAGTFWTLRYIGISATYKKKVLDCHAVSGEVSHVHNDDCFLNGELVCPLQEIEPHEHTEACYTAVLFCGLEESAGHVHTDACFVPQMELVCGLEETAGDETHPAHYHTDACYAPVRELICGLEETEGDETHPAHWHTDECYQDVMLQVCGMEEGFGAHYHTDECYSQVLICEKPVLPVHVHGPECFRTEEMTPEEIAAMDLADDSQEDEIIPEGDQLQPEATDAITGDIIEKPTETDSIEGTTNDPSPAPGNTQESVSVPESVPTDLPMQTEPFRFVSQADDILVTVEAPAEAFPAGTEMKVRAVYDEKVLGEMADAVEGNVVQVQAVDISFWFGGKEIEPMQPIRVVMTPVDVPDFDEQTVVHVDDAGSASVIEQENVAEPEAAFEVDSFSVYGLVYTKIETTVLASDGNNYKITVTTPNDVPFPEGAKLWASEIMAGGNAYGINYNEYLARTEYALGWEAGTASYVRLFDIFVGDEYGNKLTLTTPVDVKIELADKEAGTESKVVHFGTITEVVSAETDGQTVSFEASSFSVYVVVGDDENKEESRAAVNFYGKNTSTPIATVYVKNSDTADEIAEIVFDPGCGKLESKELFDGWIISTVNTTDGSEYTIETEGKTIEDVRAALEQMEICEGDVVNIYAKIVKTITITYIGESQDIILGSSIVKVLGEDSAEYEISMNYTPETAEQAFMGWNVTAGESNIQSATHEGESVEAPFPNGTTITVNGDVTLSVNAPYGHWLVFDENGKGATYHAPQFIEEGEKTQEPSGEMTRLGYSFGGWYTDKDCTAGNEFTFGSELTDNTTIYAKWTEAATANYTVIIWKERMTDTYEENGGTGEGKQKNYDFSESFTLTGNVGTTANAVSNGTSSVVDGDSAGTRYYNARIRGTRSTGGNVDRTVAYTGYHCAGYDTDVVITPEGNTVINVYYDRNTVTYTFYTYGQGSTAGTWWLCDEDGKQIIQSGRRASDSTGIATRSGNSYNQYTGIVAHDDGRTYYYSTTGTCGGTNMREAHWEYVSSSGSQWSVYQEEIGLYGEALNWPTETSIWWYENHNNTRGTGTRMTYKDAFLPLDDDMTVEYWGSTASASGTIHFWTQDVDGGDSYTDQVQVATGNANFSINDKFTGFYAYQYRTDNGSWQNVGTLDTSTGIYGSPVSYSSRLDIRYNRIKAAITFLDGSYFDGNGNRMDEDPQAEAFYTTPEYYYEADVSTYDKGGSNYYTPPEKSGYTFAGWYADDACTVEYDFNTMPATGITVYAKWIQNQYRVFLHPNVPESDTTLNWGSEDQDMNFRVSSGGTVSTPTGTRSGYKLIGWYLDEACTQVFDAEHYILNDTSVTTPYDQSVDMTDVMNKYGNITGEGTNSDAQNNRFWITRKLDLYAKWRAELIGADGIGVKYDANGGTNAPNDTNLYLDNSDTVAQGAPTPPDDTQQFLHWVLQTWDEDAEKYVDIEGEDGIVYPGETFTVLKSNAYIEELEGSTEDNPKYRYTVQLRAEYGPKDEPTPTHIWWFPNNVDIGMRHAAVEADDDLQINEAVSILDAPVRVGYEFLGWARVPEDTSESSPGEAGAMPTAKAMELTEADLLLTYHKAEGENAAYYTAVVDGNSETVTKVAADERNPYHDLFAVWKKKTYTVTVTKVVNGLDSDLNIPFNFTPAFDGLSSEDYSSIFELVGNPEGADVEKEGVTVHVDNSKTFIEVPFDTVFRITETALSEFEVYEAYDITNADNESDNRSVIRDDNGVAIVVKGDVALRVINTRKSQMIRILKTELDGKTPLSGAVFTVTIDGNDYTLTSDDDGYLKNDDFSDGIIPVPFGSYTLKETTPPDGYIAIESGIIFRVDGEGIHTSYTVKEPTEEEEYYTVIVPNNPGVLLPQTGGSGVMWMYLVGFLLVAASGILFAVKKRTNQELG